VAGWIGFCVPLVVAGAAVGATAIVLSYSATLERILLPLLCTIWGVTGLVCFVVPIVSVGTLNRGRDDEEPAKQEQPGSTVSSTAPAS
jgi:hypothetical protein